MPPFLVHVVELVDRGETVQYGGFSDRLQAERLLERLEREGMASLCINTIAIHQRFEDYEYDR